MSPDERDRLVKVETTVENMKDDLQEIKHDVKQLINALNMGRGGWITMTKIGAVLLLAVGALAWLIDHLPKIR